MVEASWESHCKVFLSIVPDNPLNSIVLQIQYQPIYFPRLLDPDPKTFNHRLLLNQTTKNSCTQLQPSFIVSIASRKLRTSVPDSMLITF